MTKGKILQVSAVSTTMDKQLRPLIETSIEAGYDVHIACSDDGFIDTLRSDGFIVHDIHFSRSINFKSNIKTIIELRNLMKEHNYDAVHLHTPVASILGRIAAKTCGIQNIIYTAHGYYFHEGMSKLQYAFYYMIEKFFAKFATDYLLLQSKEDYDLSVNKKFKKENRIIHLGNGVDIHNKFNPTLYNQSNLNDVKRELEIKDTDFTFAFIGRFVEEKGIFELIEAFNMLNESDINVKLMLIGGLNESERDQRVLEDINAWKSNPNIIFTGVRSDVPQLLALADTFILPSHREGLPRSIVEAMAMAKPVIATNIRGCREQVIENQTGFLIEKKDINALYKKMLFFTENKATCDTFGEKARKIAEAEYDELNVLEKQINLFNSLLHKGDKYGGDRDYSKRRT